MTAKVMENRDWAEARSNAITCCCTPVAETSNSQLGTLSFRQAGRRFCMTTGLTATTTNDVAINPNSDMFVSGLFAVIRNLAKAPDTVRNKASANSLEAPTGL